MTRLRLGADEVQARLLPRSKMPKAPLEKTLVHDIRRTLAGLGVWTESGRVAVFGQRGVRYLPVFGPGTPDVLCWTSTGRMFGVEVKRDDRSRERDTQRQWRELAHARGVVVRVCRTVREAVEAWQEARK